MPCAPAPLLVSPASPKNEIPAPECAPDVFCLDSSAGLYPSHAAGPWMAGLVP
jgi:hypothetical protein